MKKYFLLTFLFLSTVQLQAQEKTETLISIELISKKWVLGNEEILGSDFTTEILTKLLEKQPKIEVNFDSIRTWHSCIV